jgi:virulence-associated protein VagC
MIRFSYETEYGLYSDALNIPEDAALSEQEIELLKQQRRDNWISHIQNSQNTIVENAENINTQESTTASDTGV